MSVHEELNFVRVTPIYGKQLSDEVKLQVGVWVGMWNHQPPALICKVAPANSPLSPAQIAQIGNVVTAHVPDPAHGLSDEELFSDLKIVPIVWATVTAYDVPNRTATVQRTVLGKVVSLTAGITYSIVTAYNDGAIAVGDKVLVAFVDGDRSKPVIIDKLVL